MLLTAERHSKKIALDGAPSGATVELRIQDTSRGTTRSVTLRTDSTGHAEAEFPDFDFSKSVHAVVGDKVYRLTFDAEQSADSFHLSDGEAKAAQPVEAREVSDLVRNWIDAEKLPVGESHV